MNTDQVIKIINHHREQYENTAAEIREHGGRLETARECDHKATALKIVALEVASKSS